jgi:hypothetical protein
LIGIELDKIRLRYSNVTKLTPKKSEKGVFWGQFCDMVLTVAHQKVFLKRT